VRAAHARTGKKKALGIFRAQKGALRKKGPCAKRGPAQKGALRKKGVSYVTGIYVTVRSVLLAYSVEHYRTLYDTSGQPTLLIL
jgi:hypothetical protein